MSKARIIVSTTVAGVTDHENARSHAALLTRQFLKFPGNTVAHAIGMFEGKEELSLVIDIPGFPFIGLAATAYNLALKFQQDFVYFSHNGKAYLASATGEMIPLGTEREGALSSGAKWHDDDAYTRIIGTDHYIWTVK